MSDEEGMEYLVQTDQEKASESQVCSVTLEDWTCIRTTRFLHSSGTYKGSDLKFSIFSTLVTQYVLDCHHCHHSSSCNLLKRTYRTFNIIIIHVLQLSVKFRKL